MLSLPSNASKISQLFQIRSEQAATLNTLFRAHGLGVISQDFEIPVPPKTAVGIMNTEKLIFRTWDTPKRLKYSAKVHRTTTNGSYSFTCATIIL